MIAQDMNSFSNMLAGTTEGTPGFWANRGGQSWRVYCQVYSMSNGASRVHTSDLPTIRTTGHTKARRYYLDRAERAAV